MAALQNTGMFTSKVSLNPFQPRSSLYALGFKFLLKTFYRAARAHACACPCVPAGQSVDTFLEVPGAHPPVGVSLVGSPTNAL